MKETVTQGAKNSIRNTPTEERTALTMWKEGFEELGARLPSNQGFNGVWIKTGVDGEITDIVITESKFASAGVLRLASTQTMGKQMSRGWIEKTIQRMLESDNPVLEHTASVLRQNPELIRLKAAVLDPGGILKFTTLNRLCRKRVFV